MSQKSIKKELKISKGQQRGVHITSVEVKELPEFMDTLDPIKILETIDQVLLSLNDDPSDNNIKKISNRLKDWKIITVNHNDKTIWIMTQFKMEIVNMKRTFYYRMSHLIKTRGKWLGRDLQGFSLLIENHNNVTYSKVDNSALSILIAKLGILHEIILSELHSGTDTIGIFDNSTAIRNLNSLKNWLNMNYMPTKHEMIRSLKIRNLEEIINDKDLII